MQRFRDHVIGRCLPCPPRLFWPASTMSGLSVYSLRWKLFKRWGKVFEQGGTDTSWFLSKSHVESDGKAVHYDTVNKKYCYTRQLEFQNSLLSTGSLLRKECLPTTHPTHIAFWREASWEGGKRAAGTPFPSASQDLEALTPHCLVCWGE